MQMNLRRSSHIKRYCSLLISVTNTNFFKVFWTLVEARRKRKSRTLGNGLSLYGVISWGRLFKDDLNKTVYQMHPTNYVIPVANNRTMVRLLDRSVLGGKPPTKAKGGMKRSHLLQYVIQVQYGLGSKFLGCRGSAEMMEQSGGQRWGASGAECRFDTSGDSSCSITAPCVSTWITLGVGSSPTGIMAMCLLWSSRVFALRTLPEDCEVLFASVICTRRAGWMWGSAGFREEVEDKGRGVAL